MKDRKTPLSAGDKARHKATKPAPLPPIVCPDCGEPIEASITFDCDVDSHTGQIDRALTGGGVKLYCSMDCGWEREHADLVSVDDWPAPITADDLTPSEGGR